MVSVTLDKIAKQFGQITAVDSVSLTINPGELFFLLGPSGCGKTTLLRMIAGLLEPTAGRILFDDRDITNAPSGKRNTALVFQNYALWPHMTVAQNIVFGLDVRKIQSKEKKQRLAQVLELVQMTDCATRRPGQLSGGQQQRIALARALVVNPDVLLLDEPLSNLDAKLRLEMRSQIRRICKQTNITAIYVTHDQAEALSMADRIALMNRGQLCQIDSPQTMYNKPNTRFVADFLGSSNFINATITQQTNDQVQMKTEAGVICSTIFPENIPVGSNVICSIRPEALHITQPDHNADNTFQGKHIETMYLGEVARHTFKLTDKITLQVNEPRPRHHDWTSVPVKLSCNADEVVVLTV